ncbi:conserved hypothetical protein [Histoplasma capsulatum G186AR]|uniref:RING-type domain-containing protein n=1 Tax=Ajellomyces capsulatus (strain G186AR / H82 / ATCC MYA-2454 / RMSCC 2432) TaxID=447093 RepID=C0NVI2_AJECG|nr:uncharacterized protein HCBG_07162 [Histoplasma capsulatum G186AR]EEH04521.1 conserved hypothetical protein [Histoplasma capsulatum G186AR]
MVLFLALPSFYSRTSPQRKSTTSSTASSTASSTNEHPVSASTLSSISKSPSSSATPDKAPKPPPAAAAGSSTITEALRGNPFGIVSRTKAPSNVAAGETIEEEKERDRRELNDALAMLAQLFPDVKIEVFRELLVRFDGKSRLHVCVEQLLRYRAEWVKGRWNVPELDAKASGGGGVDGAPGRGAMAVDGNGDAHGRRRRWIPHEELFQSEEYKAAVKSALSLEFRVLSRSAIDAVLAEVNFSYARARPTLQELSRKSWRVTFGNIFPFKRKKERDDHPLLSWERLPDGELMPRLKETGCSELNRELHDTYLAPLLARRKEEQEATGLKLAEELNKFEAEAAEALYECDCCLSDVTFEQISTCSVNSHIICFHCIQRTIHESLFGQGWSRSIDHEKSTLRCLAPMSEGICEGTLDPAIVKRAILAEKTGAETYQKFEDRLVSECLLKSQLKLIRCPSCGPATNGLLAQTLPAALIAVLRATSHGKIPTAAMSLCSNLSEQPSKLPEQPLSNELVQALGPPLRVAGANNILVVRPPRQPAQPQNRRPYEEPEGYKHFCEHFRANPGSRCTECTKCDLYLTEDEEAVARLAGERAERQWRIRQGLLNSSSLSSQGVTLPSDALAKLYDMSSGSRSRGGVPQYPGYRSPVAGPLDWNWQLDASDWRRQWKFWMRDIWRNGRWKGEGQYMIDMLLEKIVVVDF